VFLVELELIWRLYIFPSATTAPIETILQKIDNFLLCKKFSPDNGDITYTESNSDIHRYPKGPKSHMGVDLAKGTCVAT
jgi:hypothetical protein